MHREGGREGGERAQGGRERGRGACTGREGEREGSVHREGEREGGEEAQKQSYTDSELIMSNSTTVINTPWQDLLTQRSLSTAYNISRKQLTRPPGRNILLVSIINSCVVAHQFAIVSVQRTMSLYDTTKVVNISSFTASHTT